MSVKGSWNRVRNQRAFAANYAAIFRRKRRKPRKAFKSHLKFTD